MNEETKIILGEKIAELLFLKKNENGRYPTTWGDKTALGLFLTLERVTKNEIPDLD